MNGTMNRIVVVLALVLLCSCLGLQANPDNSSTSMPVYLADGSTLTNVHEVVGRVTVTSASPATVKLVGAAAFTSASTYYCTATVSSSLRYLIGVHVVNTDGATFVVEADALPTGVPITYRCLGQ